MVAGRINNNIMLYVLLLLLNCIQNVLIIQNSKKSTFQLLGAMGYEHLDTIYPTGIKSKFWNSLKNIPSIMYQIEKWFNIIDLQQKLCDVELFSINPEEQKFQYKEAKEMLSNPLCIDLTLLYHACHRSEKSTNRSYQIYNTLGAHILKFISTLYAISTDPTSDAQTLDNFVKEITLKPPEENKLFDVATKLNIEGHSILHDFDWNKWNPPIFQDRNADSLYDSTTDKDLVKGDDDMYLNAYLLQSIVGAFWASIMNQKKDNSINHAIHSTLQFLKEIEILPIHYHIADEIKELKHLKLQIDDNVNNLKTRICDNLQMNTLLNASLTAIMTNCDDYKRYGITFDKLEILGEAILNMLIVWYIYCNIGDNQFNHNQLGSKSEKAEWKQDIIEMIDILANDNWLGYLFATNGLHDFISFYDGNLKQQITNYLKDIIARQNEGESLKDDEEPLLEVMKTQKSPGGYDEEDIKNGDGRDGRQGRHDDDEKQEINSWPLKIEAPLILGSTFKCSLGAIFLGSNYDVFLPSNIFKPKIWNLKYCVSYLIKFMGSNNNNNSNWNNQFKWSKWIGKIPINNNNLNDSNKNNVNVNINVIKTDTV